MKGNAVVPIVIGKSPEWLVCKKSVLKYCEKYNLHLEVISHGKYGIKPFDPLSYSINLFEKNLIYKLFKKYDRILRLDYDVIITPQCPNLFEIVQENQIGGVFEDVGIAELGRRKQIINIQNHLGSVNWKSGYMNAGVVVVSKQHKKVFNTTIKEINNIQKIKDISTPEQDYFNYMIRKLGFEIHSLDYKFNHIKYFSQNRLDSYIIHYAGSKVYDDDLKIKRRAGTNKELYRELTAIQMERDYNKIIN